MVEFALIIPVFMLLLLIAVDFGRLFFTYVQVNNAAREGAAYGASSPTDTNGIRDYALREINAQRQAGEGTMSVAVACADISQVPLNCGLAVGGSGAGNSLTVRVTEPFTFFTPLVNGFFGNNMQIGASATTAVFGLAANGGSSGPSCTTPPGTPTFSFTVSNLTVNLDASAATPNSGVCAIAGYNWDVAVSPEPDPPVTGKLASYTYASAGVYIVTLEVTNQAGTATFAQSVTVGSGGPTPTPTPTPPPTPAPTPTPTPAPVCNSLPDFTWTVGNGNRVNFFGSYTGSPVPITWSWNFGDASTGTGQNPPQHHYSGSSARTVVLTITNGTCVRTVSHTVNP